MTVDRELRFAVEDDEHLFAVVVEVRADAALRLNVPAMQEPQVRVGMVVLEQRPMIIGPAPACTEGAFLFFAGS